MPRLKNKKIKLFKTPKIDWILTRDIYGFYPFLDSKDFPVKITVTKVKKYCLPKK